MKIPRVQFTVRRMMAAVAVVALAFGIARLSGAVPALPRKGRQSCGFPGLRAHSQDSIMYWENRWTDKPHWKAREIPLACRTSVRAGHHQVSRRHAPEIRTCGPLPLAPRRSRPARLVKTTKVAPLRPRS